MVGFLLVLLCLAGAARAATLEFTEDLVIDPSGTEAEFGRIMDIVVASDGTIYVADAGFNLIHAFDDEGNWLRSFGEVGEGPGDIPAQLFRLGIDPHDNLLIAGTRSSVGKIDGHGNLVGSVSLEMVPIPRSLVGFEDGSLALVSMVVDFHNDPPAPPRAIHVFAEDGEELASFAGSSWWTPEVNPIHLRSLLVGSMDLDVETGELLYAEGRPFQLRRYRLDGTMVEMTDEGFEGFVTEPTLPEEKDGFTIFRHLGGTAWRVVGTPRGDILVSAMRMHPEDEARVADSGSEFQPRWISRVNLYDRDFRLQASRETEENFLAMESDARNRVLRAATNDDGLPIIVRYHYTVSE